MVYKRNLETHNGVFFKLNTISVRMFYKISSISTHLVLLSKHSMLPNKCSKVEKPVLKKLMSEKQNK